MTLNLGQFVGEQIHQQALVVQGRVRVRASGLSQSPLPTWYAAHGQSFMLFKHNSFSLSECNQRSALHLS